MQGAFTLRETFVFVNFDVNYTCQCEIMWKRGEPRQSSWRVIRFHIPLASAPILKNFRRTANIRNNRWILWSLQATVLMSHQGFVVNDPTDTNRRQIFPPFKYSQLIRRSLNLCERSYKVHISLIKHRNSILYERGPKLLDGHAHTCEYLFHIWA